MTEDTPPDFMSALRSYLTAVADVAALVQGRIYIPELPGSQAASMPRKTVVMRGSGGGVMMSQSYVQVGDHRVDVMSFGENPYEADRLHRAVYGALKQMRRNVQGQAMLHWAKPSSTGTALRDPDTEWPYTLSSWQVLVAETPVQ